MPLNLDDPTDRHIAAALGINTLGGQVPDISDDVLNTLRARYGGTPYGSSSNIFGSTPDTSGLRSYFGALSNEDARRYDQNYGLQASTVASENAARAAQVAQAKAALSENRRQFDRTFGLDTQKFQEGQRQFNTNTGLDILKTGAQMRGPLDAFQGAAFARGVQTGGLAPYLQTLRDYGTTNVGGGTATTGNPTPLTVGTLANAMSGTPNAPVAPGGPANTPGTGSTDAYGRPLLTGDYLQNLNAINTVAQRGVANLGLGALENLSPGELGTFKSGLDYLGRSSPDELAAYQRSRPGQGQTTTA